MLVQTWWLSTVGVDNPTGGPGVRPEWNSISLLRTVNPKIQQEWIMTIVVFVLSGPSCGCFSCIYPSRFLLEHSPPSACWCFVVGVQTLSNHLMMSGKSHSCWSPFCWYILSRQHIFTLFACEFLFFLETLRCKSYSSCFVPRCCCCCCCSEYHPCLDVNIGKLSSHLTWRHSVFGAAASSSDLTTESLISLFLPAVYSGLTFSSLDENIDFKHGQQLR